MAFELSAHMTVRPGQLEGFKKQAAECIRITREQDTHTLRYDWFLSNDGECEVREAYTGPEGLIEHNRNILEARTELFRNYADNHFMPAAAVDLHQLSKSFRVRRPRGQDVGGRIRDLFSHHSETVTAVDGLSFSIAPGERVAFIGPNGAGKSTTLKMLSGILQPDAGEVRVFGLDPSRQRRQLAFRIGTVFGQRSQLWYQLPPRDTFELLGRVYEIDPREHRRRTDALASAFGLAAFVNTPVRHLSLGERMRCEIVASLLHSPHLLFLDEPSIGLDVSAKAIIRELLWTESEREGITLLLTSHDTGDMPKGEPIAMSFSSWPVPFAALMYRS